MKNTVILILSFMLLITGCKDSLLDTTFLDKSNSSLDLSNAEFLKKNADKYSLWIELLKYADLYNALNDASATSTVFAPDNDAVKEFLIWKGVNSVQELDKEYVKNVAKVHIIKGILKENEFIADVESGSIPVITLFGTYLTTSYGFRNLDVDDKYLDQVVLEDSLSIYLNNQAKVADLGRADTTANGRIYTLKNVIHPLSETIQGTLKSYKEYGIFTEAVEKTGYDKIISVYADTVANIDGSLSINDVRFTCFAVPDEVFKAAGIQSVADLAAYLHAGSDYTNTGNALYEYIAYHFLNKAYQKSDLSEFDEVGAVSIYDTKLAGKVITLQSDNGELKINNSSTFIRSNIKARNGLIHKVNTIMPIYDPAPLKVTWDLCNAPDVESLVNSYGAAKSLGQLFSSPLSNKEYQIDLSLDKIDGNYGTISSFIYTYNTAKSSVKSWRKVGFFKCSYVSSTDNKVNKYGAYKDNLMILNLGYAGNVTFTTPTIIKGKYKVVAYYAGAPALKSFYTNGSTTKINLDDYQKSIYMWKGIPATFVDDTKKTNVNANGIASEVIWDEITFDTSGTHTFKITLMDINAKTNGSYRQMWDYIEFIPIAN